MNFPQAIKNIMDAEGGYVNHPADKGGETLAGISRKHHPELWFWKQIDLWRDRDGLPPRAISIKTKDNELMMAAIEVVYNTQYWQPLQADKLHSFIRYPFFNAAVNIGITRAVKMLQKVSGALIDGKMGPNTIKAVNNFRDKEELADLFYLEWQEYYDRIIANNPSQKVFETGWRNRIKNCKKVNK